MIKYFENDKKRLENSWQAWLGGKNEKYIEEDAKIYGRDSQNDPLLWRFYKFTILI